MKKNALFLISVLGLAVSFSVHCQDTVSYPNPWYKSRQKPTITDWRNYHDSIDSFAETYELFDNNNTTILGVACPMWRIPSHLSRYIVEVMDSVYTSPTQELGVINLLAMSANWVCKEHAANFYSKRTKYRYDFDLPYTHSVVSDCIEFYFPTPFDLSGDTIGLRVSFDLDSGIHTPWKNNFAFDETCTQDGAHLYHVFPTYHLVRYTNLSQQPYFCEIDRLYYGMANPKLRWGGIFPIVSYRCTAPRGLSAVPTDTSLLVSWNVDESETVYQLAVCPFGDTSVANATFYDVDGYSLSLSGLTDTICTLFLRKQCFFSADSAINTWSDWSIPYNVGPSTGIATVVPSLDFSASISSGTLTISLSGEAPATAELIDMQGRIVATAQVHGSTTIATSHLPHAPHILRLSTATSSASRKLILR